MSSSLKDIKLTKTQLSKIIWSGGVISRLLKPLMKVCLPLITYVKTLFAKIALVSLELAATAAADAEIHKKVLGSGITKLAMSKKGMIDIMKIVKSLEDSGL